ncbi:stage III sporulation protein AF [Pseudalkalibacillus decolorationis]|uniref:stage III sporulation protein AF n=1 Tax=Pseudalkalibacillus decolorationis TaxID=163879 RepID=UPI002149688B|nr:stage III sporulation protein AF [Pseudalkalibacillus decolorationis]
MSFIYEWITNIILIILLATVLELLLPSSAFQKYIKVVIGLLLIMAILNPLIQLMSVDFTDELASLQAGSNSIENEKMKNSIEKKKSEIQASQDAYKLNQVAVLLKKKVDSKKLEETFEKRVKDVEVQEQSQKDSKTKQPKQWIVYVTLADANDKDTEIEAVEEVTINTQEQTTEVKNDTDFREIKQFLSEEWEVPIDDIVVKEEGGS